MNYQETTGTITRLVYRQKDRHSCNDASNMGVVVKGTSRLHTAVLRAYTGIVRAVLLIARIIFGVRVGIRFNPGRVVTVLARAGLDGIKLNTGNRIADTSGYTSRMVGFSILRGTRYA
jgi:hypothetical protein